MGAVDEACIDRAEERLRGTGSHLAKLLPRHLPVKEQQAEAGAEVDGGERKLPEINKVVA